MSRKREKHPWAEHPELLTSIRTPLEKWHKADWNFARYEKAIDARPCDPQCVVYTAIDYCIATVSLRDWVGKTLTKKVRAGALLLPQGLKNLDEYRNWVRCEVRWQSAVEAIANTAKHAHYSDDGWPKGIAMPATFYPSQLTQEREACEDGLEVFAFMHKHKERVWWDLSLRQAGSEEAVPGYNAFGNNLDDWKTLIDGIGLGDA